MSDIIKAFFGNIADTLVIALLCVPCVIFMLLAILFLPLKRVRVWFGRQMMRVGKTINYFLNESMYDD